MNNCIFCKIVNKSVPAKIIYEDELVLAFEDVNPIAPVHFLVIPKKHIESINDLEDEILAGRLIMIAKKIAKEKQVNKKGYRILIRTGKEGGQEVPHVHLHLIGGSKMNEILEVV